MKVGDEEKEGFEIDNFKGTFGVFKRLWKAATEGFDDNDTVECEIVIQKIIRKGGGAEV